MSQKNINPFLLLYVPVSSDSAEELIPGVIFQALGCVEPLPHT